VTGASGYIGEEVSIALRKQGHEVWGLVRSKPKGRNLILNEVQVVIGDLMKPEGWSEKAKECSVLIHCAADYSNYEETDRIALSTLINSSEGFPTKKLLIFTSGVLVYPNNPSGVSDESVKTDPPGLLKARPDMERIVRDSTKVNGVVIRPAFVFGKKTAHFVSYFKQALEGKVEVNGSPDIMWSEVHIDDLVDGYVRIVEAPPSVVSGQIFNFSDSSRNTNLQLATAFAKEAGYKGEITINPNVAFGGFNQKTVIVDSSQARRLLGWVPRHKLLLDEIHLHFEQYMATREAQ